MVTTRELLNQRYGLAHDVSAHDALNPVLETILSHRSVRAFVPDALAAGTLELLVAAAQSAPSSSNLQVWSLVAVEERARKDRLAALAGDQQQPAARSAGRARIPPAVNRSVSRGTERYG